MIYALAGTLVALVVVGCTGGICFCLLRLAAAVEGGLGAGASAELKRQIEAVDGRVEDAVDTFVRRNKRDTMRTTREAAQPAAQPADPRAARLAELQARRQMQLFNGGA